MSDERERHEREHQREDARRARREQRRSLRDEIRRSFGASFPHDLGEQIRRSVDAGFDFADFDLGGEEFSEVVEHDFSVGHLPHLHVRNISGETRIRVGADGTIHVRARKRVRGTSEERAKRLLENVEIRMEQRGDEISVKPHLYEQDRGWMDLFRGGRVAVDLEITVPRELRIEAHTVSGDLTLAGTRGPLDIQSVSGDVTLDDVQGPTQLRAVSGDTRYSDFAGQLESNSVSGDQRLERCVLHGSDIVTVSGDVFFAGDLVATRDHRIKTVSGDVDLGLVGSSYDVRFKTMSGDLDAAEAKTLRDERRDKHIVIGSGDAHIVVKTVSGDLRVGTRAGSVPESSAAATEAPLGDVERTEPMARPPDRGAQVREVLDRLARGELDVEAAAAAIDAVRGAR